MKIANKSAPKSFTLSENLEAGIILLGSEVKAVRLGHADLAASYVKIMGSEAYLINAKIFPYTNARVENYEESRTRKLLLHKKELLALKSKLSLGKFTLIPTSMYIKNNIIKLNLAFAIGKKQYEKLKDLKAEAQNRDIEQELKRRG